MKYLKFLTIICLISCGSSQHTTNSNTNWQTYSTNKTTKIKVVTAYYGGYEGLHTHAIDVLTHMNFEIDSRSNPVTTLPRVLFGRLVKYYIDCDSTSIVIHGGIMESSLGGISNVNARNFTGKAIERGPGNLGTAWFEKMIVIAEATKDRTVYYSDK